MRWLLDTHVWLWVDGDPSRLGPRTRDLLQDSQSNLYVSAASTVEISRLVSLGFVRLKLSLEDWVRLSCEQLAARDLHVDHRVAIEAYRLPEPFQKDPGDRLLVATARMHDLTLITADGPILAYPHVRTHDAHT